MHELSIATSIVETVAEFLRENCADETAAVKEVRLGIGALSCVHESSLHFGFDLVSEGTPVAGAKLSIRNIPVAIYCETCADTFELPGIQAFRCPQCATPSADIRQGRELDIESIVLQDECDAEMDSATESASA